MNKLAKIIDSMDKDELGLLKKDLDAGNLDKLIKNKLAGFEEHKHCPTCGLELEKKEQRFTLEFGPIDLRQRAYFDELDCLTYFVEKLKVNHGHDE